MKQPVIIMQTSNGFILTPVDFSLIDIKVTNLEQVSVATELDGYSPSAITSLPRAHFKEEPDVA